MIQTGLTKYHKSAKESFMLEFCTPEMTSSLTSPRVLNTHLTHNLLPAGIKEKKCKIIHILRNPKDVATSFHFHAVARLTALKVPRLPQLDITLKTFRGALGPCK